MTPLVLIPGLGNTAALFDRLVEYMPGRPLVHVNLIAPQVTDFAGMLDHVRGQLSSFINSDSNSPQTLDILGFSMGGYVALALAQQSDLPLRRLVLAHSRARDDEAGESAERARTLSLLNNPKTRFEGMTPALFRRLVAEHRAEDRELFVLTRTMAQSVGRLALAAQIRVNQTRPDQTPFLDQVRVPTLLLAGDEDQITPPTHAAILQAGLPSARLHIVKECGHLGPLEQPEIEAALIEAFLTET